MRSALLFFILVVFTLIALIIQDFLPALSILRNTHILLVPIIFAYGALVLPFPAMLALAVFTGLITDLSTLQIVHGKVEIGLGWSIIIYAVLGTVIQGVRRAFLKGAWWLHPPISAVCTLLILTLQYLMITISRESIVFNETVAWEIFIPSMVAFLLSPLIEVLFMFIERSLSHLQRLPRGY
jgi:hypothetical protein